MKHQPFGHIVIAPKPVPHGAFWIDAPRSGFTEFCAAQMNVPIPVDDVTDGEVAVIQRRADVLATIAGYQQARSNRELRMAVRA